MYCSNRNAYENVKVEKQTTFTRTDPGYIDILAQQILNGNSNFNNEQNNDYIDMSVKDTIKLDKNRKKLCKPVGSKTKHIIMILLVSVLVVAIVGCIGIIATLITNSNQERRDAAENINKTKVEHGNYIKKLFKTTVNLKKDRQSFLNQYNRQVNSFVRRIESLKTNYNRLVKEVENLSDRSSRMNSSAFTAFTLGYFPLNDGWIAQFNGYQYKAISNRRNWRDAEAYCKNHGADLASIGVRNKINRRILQRAFYSSAFYPFWIGLKNITDEGEWRWINSHPRDNNDFAANQTNLWAPGQPGSNSHDCAEIRFNSVSAYSNDCSSNRAFMCEKQI